MNGSPSDVRVWAVVPAAGLSRRMGCPKQLLPDGEHTMVGRLTRTLLEAGLARVVVATRTALVDRLGLPNDPRVLVAINDSQETEMIDSIRIGLDAVNDRGLGDADGILVTPADIPGLSAAACRTCIEAFRADSARIVIATHQGRRGHPMIFPAEMRGELAHLAGGLRMLLRAHSDRLSLIELHDPAVTRDIDTPDDLDRLGGE